MNRIFIEIKQNSQSIWQQKLPDTFTPDFSTLRSMYLEDLISKILTTTPCFVHASVGEVFVIKIIFPDCLKHWTTQKGAFVTKFCDIFKHSLEFVYCVGDDIQRKKVEVATNFDCCNVGDVFSVC